MPGTSTPAYCHFRKAGAKIENKSANLDV
jgi:hypothetical protein